MTRSWCRSAADAISAGELTHAKYVQVVADLYTAMAVAQPGEVIVVVGPSRVGKTRAVSAAAAASFAKPVSGANRPWVLIEAENSGTDGSFSTKAFMRAACDAIAHPIYGTTTDGDTLRSALDARIARTPEATLRDAFEVALVQCRTMFVVVDEAHHVGYVRGGRSSASKILDSWKCLARKTRTVLILVGSYPLLELLHGAPHMVGRQRTIEFRRYRSDSRTDVVAFADVLRHYNKVLRFESRGTSLLSWNRYLFEHSFGCVGHLHMWLRTALARCESRELPYLSQRILEESQLPPAQEQVIAAEILQGEELLRGTASTPAAVLERKKKKSNRLQPFERKPARYVSGGRL